MSDPDDLEAVRARVRTAVDRWTGTDTLVLDKADVLALLAPTLTEEERRLRDRLHQRTMDGYEDGYAEVYVVTDDLHDALAIIDRLSGSTSTGGPTDERFPNGYPEDPVLGPYEDAAGGPSDG